MPLGATTTLLYVRSNVRGLTKTTSVQQSGLLEPTLTDMINSAVRFIRSIARTSLRDFYFTEKSVTLASTIDISTANIFDISTMRLHLTSTKVQIPILKRNVFNNLLAVHTFATGEWIASVATQGASSVFSLVVGGATSPSGAATLAYERNPANVTTDSSVLDIPDQMIPLVIDMVCLSVWRLLNQQPVQEALARVRVFTDEHLKDLRLSKQE